MSFSYTITSTVNYTPPGFTITDPLTEFPAILGNTNFAYTVNFSTTLGTITSISVTSSPLYTTETVLDADSVRIARDANQTMFAGESYDFVKFTDLDKAFENYIPSQISSANANTAVYRWNTPSVETVTGTYVFAVTYISNETLLSVNTNITYTQELHWDLDPGLQSLLELVDRSKF